MILFINNYEPIIDNHKYFSMDTGERIELENFEYKNLPI